MTYNVTNITAQTNLISMTLEANSQLGGWIGVGSLLIIMVGIPLTFVGSNDFLKVLMADGFISSLYAMLLFFSGAISWIIVLIPIILLVGSAIALMISKSS